MFVSEFSKSLLEDPPASLMEFKGVHPYVFIGAWPSGVYFLCSGTEIVYVGKATNTENRVIAHKRAKAIPFDRAYVLSVPTNLLDKFEGAFIQKFKPQYNIQRNLRCRSDKEAEEILSEIRLNKKGAIYGKKS